MVGAIEERCLDADYRITGQRTLCTAFLYALFYCREVVLWNGTAKYLLFKDIRCLEIAGRLEGHLNVTKLSMSTGLFLMFGQEPPLSCGWSRGTQISVWRVPHRLCNGREAC